MRSVRLAAALVVAAALVPELVLPLPAWAWVIPVVTLGVAAALVYRFEKGSSLGNAEQRRRALDQAITSRVGNANADQQRAIAAMQGDVEEALQKLSGAMPGRTARHAIDALPWYLVLGAPETGKSSLLASSGLPFAFVTSSGGARGNRGVRWWISQRAVWLDTQGAYALGEGGYAEWLSFLKTLEAKRPDQPLHGVVVTVAADQFQTMRPEDVEHFAQRMRERVDEAQGFLGIDVPVYLVVTRCDLLPGFLESFADLREPERKQILGATMPFERPKGSHPVGPYAEAFDALGERLVRRLYKKGAANVGLDVRVALYQFPQWFRSLRSGVMQIAGALAANSSFQEAIAFRGVYFTSAAEAAPQNAGYRSGQGAERGFFIRDLLDNVVIADHEHALRSAAERARRQGARVLTASVFASLAYLAVLLPWHARSENATMIERFRGTMNAAVAQRPPATLRQMDALRAEVVNLRETTARPPLHMGFGMFMVDRVAPRASTLLAALVFRDVSAAIVQRHQAELLAFANRYGAVGANPSPDERVRVGETLRMYQFLTTPRAPGELSLTESAQVEWFVPRVVAEWRRTLRGDDGATAAAMTAVVRLYAAVLAEDARLGAQRDTTAVDRVRAILAR